MSLEDNDKQTNHELYSGLEADSLKRTKEETTSMFRSRSLRVIHGCNFCNKTFSSEEKLEHHKNSKECSHLEYDADSDFEMEEESAKKLKLDNDYDELKDSRFSDKDKESSCCEGGGNAAYPQVHDNKIEKDEELEYKTSEPNKEIEDADLDIAESRKNRIRQNKCLLTVCPECFEYFDNFYEMISHLKSIHTFDMQPISTKLTVEIINFPGRRGVELVKNFLVSEESEFEVFARVEVPTNIFTCSVDGCGQMFFYENALSIHSRLHGEFKCQFCDVAESNALDIAEHELEEHAEFVPGNNAHLSTYSCPRCEQKFSWKLNYLRHYLDEHLGIERVLEQCCPICRDPCNYLDRFSTLPDKNKHLEQHLKEVHDLNALTEATQLVKCEAEGCAAYFLTKKQLLPHFRTVHCKEKNRNKRYRMRLPKHKCKDCGRTLRNKKLLKLHRINHHVSVDKLIFCTVKGCEHKFELNEDLDRHLKIGHRGKTEMEMCPKCGKYFIEGSKFRQHLQAHERKEKVESGEKSFVCEGCGKSFKHKQGMERHALLVHAGPEAWKFECTVCSKKFFQKQMLDAHMRVHTGERPFVCQVCGQAYSYRKDLRTHVNSKHGDVIQDIAKKRDTSNDAPRRKGKGILSQQKK